MKKKRKTKKNSPKHSKVANRTLRNPKSAIYSRAYAENLQLSLNGIEVLVET